MGIEFQVRQARAGLAAVRGVPLGQLPAGTADRLCCLQNLPASLQLVSKLHLKTTGKGRDRSPQGLPTGDWAIGRSSPRLSPTQLTSKVPLLLHHPPPPPEGLGVQLAHSGDTRGVSPSPDQSQQLPGTYTSRNPWGVLRTQPRLTLGSHPWLVKPPPCNSDKHPHSTPRICP